MSHAIPRALDLRDENEIDLRDGVQVETSTSRQLQIDPRGPFRLDLTAWALRRRSHNAVDRWDADTYERVVSLDGAPVALSVTQVAGPDAPRLSVVLAGGRVDQSAKELARGALDGAPRAERRPLAVRRHGRAGPVAGVLPPLGGSSPRAFRPSSRHWSTTSPASSSRSLWGSICSAASPPNAEERCPPVRRARARSPIPRISRPPDDQAPRLQLHQGPHDYRDRPSDHPRRARFGGTPTAGGWRGDRASDQPARRRPLDGRVRPPPRPGRLHVFPGDDVGAHNKLRQLFGIDTPLDHEAVGRLVARWHPYAGVVYFHLLLDSLSRAGLAIQA